MLPIEETFGERLAAILPTVVSNLTGIEGAVNPQPVKTIIVMVVDGLGWHNLQARRGHARHLTALDGEPITTVFPTTTGAALSTLTTGTMPGAHGLVGYRIRHPQLGLRTTLSQWQDITDVRTWQRQRTVFERAHDVGVTSHVIGRTAHQQGGLTEAILTGAIYHPHDTIEARCEQAIALAHGAQSPTLIYAYVDELDRAGHAFGWQSNEWTMRLEQLDAAVHRMLQRIPADTGFLLTADHGMIDVVSEDHTLLDDCEGLLDGVQSVGGEPRLRYLYLDDPLDAEAITERAARLLGDRAWVLTRETALAQGLYGDVDDEIKARIGDIIIVARKHYVFFTRDEAETSQQMIGHHGSVSEAERHVPLITAGAITLTL